MSQVAAPPQTQTAPGLRLAACLLLAGSLRPSPLTAAAGCSVLDLFLNPSETVLDVWLRHFDALAASVGQTPVVQVIHGMSATPPKVRSQTSRLELKFQQDSQQFRGPAGAVRDACHAYDPESTVVVAEAARYVSGNLTGVLAQHVEASADISVVVNRDSSPAGLFVVRCSTLALVQAKGFTDLKEQWLKKAVEAGSRVRVHQLVDSCSYELRTREGFLQAAEAAGGLSSPTICATSDVAVVPVDAPGVLDAVSEDVTIGARAVIVDSVVMPGASIGEEAVIARSIICPGAVVGARQAVIDGVVPAGRETEG
jgi:hypothetical protein